MTAFTEPAPEYWNPNDTTSLQCGQDGVTGGAIQRTGGVEISTDSTALAALPAGHSVARFIRGQDSHEGTFIVGYAEAVASGKARVAARWYIYHTPTFDFKFEGTCENSKITGHQQGVQIDYSGGFHIYNFLTWDPSVDCCVNGPGTDAGLASSEMKGKWWRFECVMTNRAGPDFRIILYGQNVTDNGAELELIDLWDDGSVDNLTPPALMSYMTSNNHRFSNGNECRGWIGISHYLMASWDTDSGQRIGAASEVEGGGSAIARGGGLGSSGLG